MALEQFDVQRYNEMLTWLGVSGCSYKKVLHANDKADGGYSGVGFLKKHQGAIACGAGHTFDHP